MNIIWVVIAKLFIAVRFCFIPDLSNINASFILFKITIIMWEVAIAVLVFEARTKVPTSNLKPEGFAIWKDTTRVIAKFITQVK